MCIFLAALLGILFSTAVAVACDDHHGKCTLEAWRSSHVARIGMLKIEGSATCNEGFINIRLYERGEVPRCSRRLDRGACASGIRPRPAHKTKGPHHQVQHRAEMIAFR